MRYLVLALWLCSATAWAAGSPVVYHRQLEYRLPFAGGKGPYETLTWSYPVVTPADTPPLRQLNRWLREVSLEPLKSCVTGVADDVWHLPDDSLVKTLRAGTALAECDLTQSEVAPLEAFGRYVSVERHTEWLGLHRPHHGIEVLLFDVEASGVVAVETLFKPGALAEFNGALGEQIAQDASRPDCRGREFDWSQVSLRPPAQIFIRFPFHPREWSQCGDGVEMLQGQIVSAQLRDPASLRPVRRWEQLRR